MKWRWLLPVVFAGLYASCNPGNIEEDQRIGVYLKENGLTGCFGLYDNGTAEFTVYNLNRFRDTPYLPASTFKIVNSLIALETGVAKDSAMVIPWDSVDRGMEAWNHDLSMQQAFTVSSVPWFRELARRIGKDTMQHFLDTLGYASRFKKAVINDNLDTFWLDNSVKITADEQLGLMKKLYFGQLPFQPRSQRIVRNMMKREDNANYKLYCKTGWASDEKRHSVGWIVGWIEENRHPYFFVLQLDSANPDYDMTNIRLVLLKKILAANGFMEGKR